MCEFYQFDKALFRIRFGVDGTFAAYTHSRFVGQGEVSLANAVILIADCFYFKKSHLFSLIVLGRKKSVPKEIYSAIVYKKAAPIIPASFPSLQISSFVVRSASMQ